MCDGVDCKKTDKNLDGFLNPALLKVIFVEFGVGSGILVQKQGKTDSTLGIVLKKGACAMV